MRWSKTIIPTLREDPQEAEIPSHRLMLRAGLIRRLAGGLYSFLPLGLRALRKVERIIREEMDRAGALEVLMPALQPRELWERSGRFTAMGEVMFRLKDRQSRDMVLGPTHEEVITELVAHELRSYRHLPKIFYQIQTKFRDEIRPRFGLMRAKEFIMKDAYSFDATWELADCSYQAIYDAYVRIFRRCGLRTKVVEADTGAMGGKFSHEFMVLAETGEDGIVECGTCSYAANLERAERKPSPIPVQSDTRNSPLPEEVATPGMRTIEQVSRFLGCEPARLIKTLIYVADAQPIAVLIPGDRELNEQKLKRAINANSLVPADEPVIRETTGAPVGFAGPVGLRIPIYADFSLVHSSDAVTGANKADTHLRHVTLARDATVSAFFDLCVVRHGDPCPRCNGTLQEMRGIEVGHVFKLGTKYSESFGARFLDENGHPVHLVMGCYGIGVTRTLQAVIEQSHDAKGIVWPISVAPYRVVLLVLNPGDQQAMAVAETLYSGLLERGIDVLLDDRDERPGVKFNDADLIGFPLRVVIGEKTLAQKCVELKLRAESEKHAIPIAEAVKQLAEICARLENQLRTEV